MTGQQRPSILLIGTCDTKADEILFMKSCMEAEGALVTIMDVGVLGQPAFVPEVSNAEVAAAAGSTIAGIAALGDENAAMTKMAAGAAALTRRLYNDGAVQGLIALGGSMGTDLALDAAAALPLGVPKFVVSTVAFSHLLPSDRMSADLMMILWAGGLYGLNSICKSVLSQACGAVVGAARSTFVPQNERPVIGMTSLGKSCLQYMVHLKPALEARGYEVAVFHSLGMGGRAFESLTAQGRFAAVLDLCLQEYNNEINGSIVSAGASRLTAAGLRGIPQIVAPGATDMIDFQTWRPLPEKYQGRPYHAHNRLIASVTNTPAERREFARAVAARLGEARGPVSLLLPLRGIEQWDRPNEPLHDPEGLACLIDEFRKVVKPPVQLVEVDAHINDQTFSDRVLAIFDDWVARGLIVAGNRETSHA